MPSASTMNALTTLPRRSSGEATAAASATAACSRQRGLDLERADPVAGRDDHVVGAALVPDVAVLVERGGVLGVEPVAAERLLGVLRVVPVADRIVRVRARAQADLAALALRQRLLVLVEDLHVPARHRLAHRALADVHERVVGDERIGLREPVVVEHGQRRTARGTSGSPPGSAARRPSRRCGTSAGSARRRPRSPSSSASRSAS